MIRFTILVTITLVCAQSFGAFAICHRPPPKLCQVFFDVDTVIHGRVLEAKYSKMANYNDPEDDTYGMLHTVQVLRACKGSPLKTIQVESANGNSGGVVLVEGKDYIMFISHAKGNSYVMWNNCEGIQGVDGEPCTSTLESAVLRLLEEKDSTIEVEVRDREWRLSSGKQVTVTGQGLTRTLSVIDGIASIKVAPGKYKVMYPSELRESSYSFYLSFGPEANSTVSLEPGQCAQIQFQEIEPRTAQ